jgi:sec-independent protein translocase protein TatC
METLKVSAYAGLLLSLPLILYELYAFILPAFSPREREVAIPAMLGIPILFVAGVVFGYFTVVPSAIKFLQNFNTDSFDVLVQAQPYYKFVILLLAAMGLLFQIPVFLVAANKMGVVTARMLSKNRRYAILVIAVVAMVLPGQDPVTMTLLMLPMYVLYELSILVVWLLDRRARRHEAEMEAAADDADAPSEPERELVTLDQD